MTTKDQLINLSASIASLKARRDEILTAMLADDEITNEQAQAILDDLKG